MTTARAARQGWRYTASVIARVLAAALGGYGIPALFAFATARLLPFPPIEAVLPGTLLSFVLMPAVVICAFLVRSATRAWGGMLLVAGLLGLICWWTA